MTHLKLIHSQDKNAKALGKQLAQSDQSISDGAVAKLSGVPIDEIKELEDSPVLEISLEALPLATAVRNAKRIAKNALEYQDHENALSIQIKAMKIIVEAMEQGSIDYNYNLGIANRESRGNNE